MLETTQLTRMQVGWPTFPVGPQQIPNEPDIARLFLRLLFNDDSALATHNSGRQLFGGHEFVVSGQRSIPLFVGFAIIHTDETWRRHLVPDFLQNRLRWFVQIDIQENDGDRSELAVIQSGCISTHRLEIGIAKSAQIVREDLFVTVPKRAVIALIFPALLDFMFDAVFREARKRVEKIDRPGISGAGHMLEQKRGRISFGHSNFQNRSAGLFCF